MPPGTTTKTKKKTPSSSDTGGAAGAAAAATGTGSTKNSTTPVIPKSALDKIVAAIRNQPSQQGPKGVSRTAIAKYVKSEFGYDNAVALRKAFQKGVQSNKLAQEGHSFRVVGDPVAELPKEPPVTIRELKKSGKGKAAEAGDAVVVAYEGRLEDGTVFDSATNFEFVLGAGDVIKGWDVGVMG